MKRRTLLTASLASTLPILGCTSEPLPARLELCWDEQVRLFDGRVIVVKKTHIYQRLNVNRGVYDEPIIPRDSELTFSPDGGPTTITQRFIGFRPIFLDTSNGDWFLASIGGSYASSEFIEGQNWSKHKLHSEHNIAKLKDGKWVAIPMTDFPEKFRTPNMLVLYGKAKDHSRFHKHLVTLEMKDQWLKEFPVAGDDARFPRQLAGQTILNKDGKK
jgi:hypothetical protein